MTETRGFPLFSLPYVALKDVVLSLDIFSRLNLSSCSKKSKSIAGSYKMSTLEIESINFCENSEHIVKISEIYSSPEPKITHTLNIIPSNIEANYGKIIEISGFEWKLHHNSPMNLIAKFSVFYKVPQSKSVGFNRDVEKSDINDETIVLFNTRKLGIQKEKLTTEELNLIFSKLHDIQVFSIWSEIPEDYDNYEIWKAKEIRLRDPPRTSEDLLRMDCEKLICNGPKFKTSDLNLFLKKWMQLTLKKEKTYLKREIAVFRVETDSNLYEDLPITPWNPNQRGQYFQGHCQYFHNFSIDCSQGFDLFRDDGVLATVIFDHNAFKFYIWHERFPVVTDTRPCY
ncbi:hypothetical protein CRE_13351 [Caenorhabditis remanei]|uniref:F-box domain-containing protein n=1 Tax=Caenorhabditis remanei TaxID=31234 RepID=E3M8C1_CAERE|nr:hypothetical protein CRE_13351 [Caenorhabditis remanei]